MERGLRSKDRPATALGTGARTRSAAAIVLASLVGCSIGTGTHETFGSVASVGADGSGSDDSGSADDPDGSGDGSGQGDATSADPPGDTDDPPPGSEVCNGLDDDGDGTVDEDLPPITCGVGSCEVTEPSCVGGVPQECTPALPGAEICNGLDDDCNGTVDDVGGTCSTSCGEGTVVCMGTEQACDAPPPQPESCNLVDDDCNGSFDDGVAGCRVGIHRSLHSTTGEHFYTASLDEAQCCGFVLESANFFQLYAGPHAGLVPFYRCYGAGTNGDFHFYTQDPGCEGIPVNEGAMGYIATAQGTAGSVPLFRLYLAGNGDHFYTTSAAERDNAVATYGYIDEGVAGYVW